MSAIVSLIMGSASDLPHAKKAAAVLSELGIAHEVGIASAHRTPEDVVCVARGAASRGVKVIIAMAGLSAALPGVVAAHTTLPVIGVPIASGALSGVDALYSIAQMPPGVPVGSVGIDGARNAALLAARIISTSDETIAKKLAELSERSSREARASRSKIAEAGLPETPSEAFGE